MIAASKKEYIPEKVLDIKQQQGQNLILIKWRHTPIEQATWQTQEKLNSSYPQIHQLIQEYTKTRTMDKGLNFLIKNAQKTQIGQNPYFQTSRHGHFLYGDEIDKVDSVKVYKSINGQQPVAVIFQIRWKPRIQVDENDTSKKTVVILQNSFMDTKSISQYEPDFLANFYESRITLNSIEPNSKK